MPNWYECDLFVSGLQARVKEFLEFACGEDTALDFNRFVAYPEEFRRLDEAAEEWDRDPGKQSQRPKDGFNSGGYEWRMKHWGTKGNAVGTEVGDLEPVPWSSHEGVMINFGTPWSPPLPVIVKAAECFPDLVFDLFYYECGVGFHGHLKCVAGEVATHESGPYFGNRGG